MPDIQLVCMSICPTEAGHLANQCSQPMAECADRSVLAAGRPTVKTQKFNWGDCCTNIGLFVQRLGSELSMC